MHPCRYSFPGGRALNKYTLISTQHSLHLYQPVTLPCDYLTGEAAELKDAPIEKNWKKHLRLMPTPGLIGYSGDILNVRSIPSKRTLAVRRDNLPRVNTAQNPDLDYRVVKHSGAHRSAFSSQEGASAQSEGDHQSLISDHPSAFMDPLLPAEMMDSMLSPSIVVREGRESFIRYGLTDLTLTVSSSQLNTDVSTQSTINRPLTPLSDSKRIMISAAHRASMRRIQSDGKSTTYRETCEAGSGMNTSSHQESFFTWLSTESSLRHADSREHPSVYASFPHLLTSELSPSLSDDSPSATHTVSVFEGLLSCNSDTLSEEDLKRIVHEYRLCKKRDGSKAGWSL